MNHTTIKKCLVKTQGKKIRMLLHKLIHPIVAASAIPIKILVFRVNCQEKNEGKKENDDYKIFLESLLITI